MWLRFSVHVTYLYSVQVIFTKWLSFAILDDRTNVTFDRISRHFRSIRNYFSSKWPPAAILEIRFAPKTIGLFHYVLSMAMPNMKLIGELMTKLQKPQAFWACWYKMAAKGHFVFPIDAKNHRVLVIWDLNGYGGYAFDWCICDKVMACTSVGVRWRRRRRRNQKHNTPEFFKFRGYNYMNECSEYYELLYLMIKSWTVIGRCSMFYKR